MTTNSKRSPAISAVLLVVVAGIAAAAGLLVWQQVKHVQDDRQADSDRAKVVALSNAQVLDLTTLNAKNLNENLGALGGRSTGEFKTQLKSLSSVFTSIIGKQDVVSKGDIKGTGVVSLTDKKAQVLVAATASVTQKSTTEPKTQRYRMSVDLTKQGGKWLISGMEFVP